MIFGTQFNVDKKLKPLLQNAANSFQMESNEKSIAMEQKMYQVAKQLAEDPPKEEKARIRAEALIRDENLIEAYEILRSDCELLADRSLLIQNSKVCPSDILLCVSRLLYASERVSITELKDIRAQLQSKYGKKFVSNTEVNVLNDRIVAKLSVHPPESTIVHAYLKALCEKCNVNWIPGNSFSKEQTIEPMLYPVGSPFQTGGQWGIEKTPIFQSRSANISQENYNFPITHLSGMMPMRYPATSEYNAIEVNENLPRPYIDMKVDMTKPVKVFILMGQSNMVGFGETTGNVEGCLDYTVREKKRFTHLVDEDGNWTVRKNVRNLFYMSENLQVNDRLKVGNTRYIGPETQFGSILGELYDGPVLLLKACIGNRSLGWDLLPPTVNERSQYGDRMYAAYRDRAAIWDIGTEPIPNKKWYAGKQYDIDANGIKHILSNIRVYYPGAQSYEIAGFVFWQGHKDTLNRGHAENYKANLEQFIMSLWKDFKAPGAKFLCATVAFDGHNMKGNTLKVANAQLSINENEKFKGNAKTVDVRSSWRNSGPKSRGHHYNHHSETYMEVGDALGWAMVDLLVNHQQPLNLIIPGTEQWDIRPVMDSAQSSSNTPSIPFGELEEIPRPADDLLVDITRPVKVFILLGGMAYMGGTKNVTGNEEGDLEFALKEKMRFSHLMDKDGKFTVRKNVRCIKTSSRGYISKNELLSVEGIQRIGCEIQFGSVIGEKMKEEPILIIKSVLGGHFSIGYDFVTPDKNSFTDGNGKTYPGYGDNFLPYENGSTIKTVKYPAGHGYDKDIGTVKHILQNLADYYPGATSYEIIGFVWWQGRGEQPYLDHYEANLKHTIEYLRNDFNAPEAKFVCATAGYTQKIGSLKEVIQGTKNVGNEAIYPEFKGNVKTIDSRPSWQPPRATGKNKCSHAEVYMEVGDAMGRAMVNMLDIE